MRVGRYARIGIGVAAVGVMGAGAVALAHDNQRGFRERLEGYQEVPALSSPGFGTFKASLNREGTEISYRLTFGDLPTPVLQSHIHFENATNNGPVVVFLCTNLGNGPAGTPACPAAGGTVTGTIDASDVGAGATAQGLAAGEFDEFVDALRSGATYVNVHTQAFPGGEIRAQIQDNEDDND